MSIQPGAFVGLLLTLAACAPIAADAGSPPNARVWLAQACPTSDSEFCESAEIACLRDCSNITRCVRKRVLFRLAQVIACTHTRLSHSHWTIGPTAGDSPWLRTPSINA
jgi:hypothetical protein